MSVAIYFAVALFVDALLPSSVFAAEATSASGPVYDASSTIWVLLAAMLVFFMQAGFGMVEAGLIRAKN
ncbi:MAG: ammonium transporter, partial [bacterium]|nr:ammonium transporter [bacterium]